MSPNIAHCLRLNHMDLMSFRATTPHITPGIKKCPSMPRLEPDFIIPDPALAQVASDFNPGDSAVATGDGRKRNPQRNRYSVDLAAKIAPDYDDD